MPRKPRTDFPGAWHHVMHRGARRVPIFNVDRHIHLLMDAFDTTVDQLGLEIHAYALMPNHYHLLVRVPHGNLSACMKRLNSVYTIAVNSLHGWDGSVFRGRFRSQLIGDESYLTYLLAYLHLDPLRAGLARSLSEQCWTSHRAYLGLEQTPRWLTTETLRSQFGSTRELNSFVASLRKDESGWPEILRDDDGWLRPAPDAARPRNVAAAMRSLSAEQVLDLVCKLTGSDRGELRRSSHGPGANPARRFAVWALRRSCGYSHRQIGKALAMSETQVAKVLSRLAVDPGKPVGIWMTEWAWTQ